MAMQREAPNAVETGLQLLGNLSKLPAPDKVFFELQRFNNNMEKIQPDMARLAKALEGVNGSDIRNLALALQGIKVSELLLAVNEANSTISKLYEKLWGKK
jgi:hypothetical protein